MENTSRSQDPVSLLQQNRVLTEEIQRRVGQLAAINTVATTVSQSLDLDLTLNTSLDAVLSIVPVDAAGISLIDEAAGRLVLRAQRGWKYDFVTDPMSIPLDKGLSGQVIREDRLIVTGDLRGDQRLAVPAFTREKIKAQALVPMHARGRVVGILSVMHHLEYTFEPEQLDVLKAIADQIGVALDNARLFEETHRQETRLSAIIQSAADAIIVTNPAGEISLINPAAQHLLGLRADSTLGLPLEKATLPVEVLHKLHDVLHGSTTTTPSVLDVSLESGQVLAGVVSHLLPAGAPDQAQGTGGRVILLRDVSHLKQAEETRMQFIQNAAHDLRNPLGVTLSALVMLRDSLPMDDPTVAEIYDIAIDAMNRMQVLLDDLLELEHIQGRHNFETQRVDPRPILVSVYREMGPLFAAQEQTCVLEVPSRLPEVNLAVDWFRRAVGNYLSNANKYTQAGGQIKLRACVQGKELLIEVEDNGPGIPLDTQERLFDRFYRAFSSTHPRRGSGLGLAMVKSVAEAHGGRVYFSSKPGRGSTFGMALPLA